MTAQRGRRPTAPGSPSPDDVAAIIRVDHAGEYGAVRIYEGQLAVLGGRPHSGKTAAVIRKMAEQEQVHLETFDRLINERRVRPTALEPVWRIAGFALGAATALMGEKAAMACTAAVEEVIDEHYARQLERLGNDPELKDTVDRFRADEISHRDEALAHGAEDAPGYRLLSETIKAGCKLAIRLSERL
jgi:ubiquinone biosynthesis monooxygenase Coq7